MNGALRKVMALPHIKDSLIALGTDPETSTPDELAHFVRSEVGRAA